MYLIAGLGNPGPRYKNTRHNIGYMVVQRWANELGVRFTGRRFQSRYGQGVYQGRKIVLLCPHTFMNLSGIALKACAGFFKPRKENILVIHDDMDLPVGRVKVIKNGGAGGHKGVLSVFDHLGSREFNRLKVGIGRPRHEEPDDEFVLSPFYAEEEFLIEKVIQLAVQACEILVSAGVERAMNDINCQSLEERIDKPVMESK